MVQGNQMKSSKVCTCSVGYVIAVGIGGESEKTLKPGQDGVSDGIKETGDQLGNHKEIFQDQSKTL
jgi:hypothetical protein